MKDSQHIGDDLGDGLKYIKESNERFSTTSRPIPIIW